ncbi:MAG: prepilin-type N-terminal cleavage/methylation domain-containing protein [Kiritimatiellae bacterium]|nr:prepilin-type N-terminal cleavage/methylation domain-containing protein [Kiritimatiellia bacterium]
MINKFRQTVAWFTVQRFTVPGLLCSAVALCPGEGASSVAKAMADKSPRRVRPRSGFTLIEVMVCSVIFVLFCVSFLNSAFASIRSQQLACDYYKAMTIARNRIQRATQFEYDSILLMSEDQVAVDGKGNIASAGIYRRTTSVSVYTNGTPNLLQFTVQVHYPGARRTISTKPVELSTLITDNM